MRRLLTRLAVLLGIGAAQVPLASILPTNAGAAVAPVMLLNAAVVVAVAPWLPLLAVLPSAFAFRRVGPAALELSVADAMLLLGVAAGVRFVPWGSPPLRRFLAAVAVYEGVLLIALVTVLTRRSGLEWLHRISLAGGAAIAGSAIAACGLTTRAIRCYFCTSAVVAVVAVLDTLTGHLQPAYPFGIQKNSAGLLLAVAVLLTFIAPLTTRLGPSLLIPLRVILLLGLLATLARGAMAGLIVALMVWAVRSGRFGRTGPIVLLGIIAMVVTIFITTDREVSNVERVQLGGIQQRRTTNDGAMAIWAQHRWAGAGLRYFNDERFKAYEPENAVVGTLAETGVVGLGALATFLILVWGAIRLLPGELGQAARLLLVAKLVGSMTGIFWVAGAGSITWVVIGIAIGTTRVEPSPRHSALRVRHGITPAAASGE